MQIFRYTMTFFFLYIERNSCGVTPLRDLKTRLKFDRLLNPQE